MAFRLMWSGLTIETALIIAFPSYLKRRWLIRPNHLSRRAYPSP